MLGLFLRLLRRLALAGEEGMPVQQLLLEAAPADPATREYLLALLRRDPRVRLSEDGRTAAASQPERRRALGGDELEDEDLMRMLAYVGKAGPRGVLSPELKRQFGDKFAVHADKLVALGLLAKQIVRIGSAASGTNIYMLPQFVKEFKPAERGMVLGTAASERTEAYNR